MYLAPSVVQYLLHILEPQTLVKNLVHDLPQRQPLLQNILDKMRPRLRERRLRSNGGLTLKVGAPFHVHHSFIYIQSYNPGLSNEANAALDDMAGYSVDNDAHSFDDASPAPQDQFEMPDSDPIFNAAFEDIINSEYVYLCVLVVSSHES